MSHAYAQIAKTGPGNQAKREKLLEVIEHLSKHKHRMRYHALRQRDLDIATGSGEGSAIWSACASTDRACAGVSTVPSTCCTSAEFLINGQWDDFTASLGTGPGVLRLAATPTPTRSHDAVKVAA
jgi:hypothetical protein